MHGSKPLSTRKFSTSIPRTVFCPLRNLALINNTLDTTSRKYLGLTRAVPRGRDTRPSV